VARIYRTIESLKSLKSELENKGITRFNSVIEINDFLSNYNSEKLTILNNTSDKLDIEYYETRLNLEHGIQNKAEIINLETARIDNRISDLRTKIDLIHSNKGNNFFRKLLSSVRLYFIKNQFNHFVKNKTKQISSSVKEISKTIENDELFIKEYEVEKQHLIEKRAKSKIEKLEYTRNVLENSRNLISGVIGENLVVKEIKKLSDDYALINDFNLSFSRPIFIKNIIRELIPYKLTIS